MKDSQKGVTRLSAEDLRLILLHSCNELIASEPLLTELDTKVGDGDHGEGMRDGFTDLREVLSGSTYKDVFSLMREAGMTLVRSMGGASGVIFGTLFTGGYTTIEGLNSVTADEMLEFFKQSAAKISYRGRCQAGDRTVLDALLPAIEAMEEAVQTGADFPSFFYAAKEGARAGAEATKQMLPRLGRSKNFREHALGYPDPGAVSLSILFNGLYTGLVNRQKEYDY